MSTFEPDPLSAVDVQPLSTVDLEAGLTELEELVGLLAQAPDDAERVPDKAAQRLLTAAVRLYVAKVRAGSPAAAFPDEDAITATEVVVAVSRMLEAVEVEVFELAVWQNWGVTGKGA
ncbi:hypothetical protein ACQPZF_24675 [Actinosynnema sp. CS-041913]|uniref:hypothetical protein n=1 Tax=Actinosynnema sp. CS-041913 TaxID=3239917 RepID=UPI003D8DB56E